MQAVIPLATTTIAILRTAPTDDAYPDTLPTPAQVAQGIRAHISRPHGEEAGVVAQPAILRAKLICDPCELLHTDSIRDETTGLQWDVDWVALRTTPHMFSVSPTTDHLEAGIHRNDAGLRST